MLDVGGLGGKAQASDVKHHGGPAGRGSGRLVIGLWCVPISRKDRRLAGCAPSRPDD
jgi:hypothetical protein